MYPELRKELYKLRHRKLPWTIILLMLALMIIIGLGMGRTYSKLLVMTCYDSSVTIMLLLIIVGSTIFSMEFQNGTIISLMYRAKSRSAVFFAKYITLVIYNVILHVIAMILTVLLNIVPIINNPVSWTAIYKYHQPLVVNMFMNTGVDLVTSTFIISLICLFSCLINSNVVVIAINALLIFMGSGLSSNLLLAHVGPSKIIRWNPFNMLNLTNQYYNYATYHISSMLTNGQLLTGTICYTIIFTLLAYWIFQRKHF
ncbi:ABC transporter permease [Limosilactobacillus mucosae]|uniref:ABC transporter permease n=1 Tax=Limosilactobacillus mucosae TaxID=97478 RepID=UPI00233F2497|nr:ABC transporter permease [Limosilactobacillus mucosae]MDC2838541.1 ABC transporter permease [Limosilactobacillus mucosae]MDC2844301.1 ABC transporter permease [Limosilactobacillus mucosae]